MQSCKKEKSVNREGFFWQGTYNTHEKTYLKEGALPGSLVDVRTPHAEDILALVHLVEGHEHAVCFFFFPRICGICRICVYTAAQNLPLHQSSCAPGYPTSRKGIGSAKTRWGVEGSRSLFIRNSVSVGL